MQMLQRDNLIKQLIVGLTSCLRVFQLVLSYVVALQPVIRCRGWLEKLTYVFFLIVALCAASTSVQAKNNKVAYDAFTLRIELSPAMCALHPKRARLRQCREGFALSVSGLRPEPSKKLKQKKQKNCSQQQARLAPLQAKVISRIMPDQAVRNRAWQKYGACTSYNVKDYFRFIARLSSQLKVPKELSTGNDYVVNQVLFLEQLQRTNRGLDRSHVQLICQKQAEAHSAVLTELQVCYDNAGKFSNCRRALKVTCPTNFKIVGLP